MPEEWSAWVTESDGALRVGRVVRALTGAALVGALAVAVATLVTGKPADWETWLLLPGMPILVAGQLWGIATLLSRKAERPPATVGEWWSRVKRQAGTRTDPREFFFSGLPTSQANLFIALPAIAGIFWVGSAWGGSEPDAAAALMAFYAMQTGMSTAELARRRAAQIPHDRAETVSDTA